MDEEAFSLPRHVAIIIDGNRRWAKARGLPYWEGHIRGGERVEEISKASVEAGIKYITIWGGSYNNLTKRTPEEVGFLDKNMYRAWATKGIKDKTIHDKKVQVQFLGEWPDLLSQKTQNAIRKIEDETKDYSNYFVTYLVGYSGDREMVSAMNSAIQSGIKEVSEETLKDFLWTKDLPEVDLLIRTGGDAHNSSGFMMWHTKNSLFSFEEKMWPDFSKEDFLKLIRGFSQRERRFGK